MSIGFIYIVVPYLLPRYGKMLDLNNAQITFQEN